MLGYINHRFLLVPRSSVNRPGPTRKPPPVRLTNRRVLGRVNPARSRPASMAHSARLAAARPKNVASRMMNCCNAVRGRVYKLRKKCHEEDDALGVQRSQCIHSSTLMRSKLTLQHPERHQVAVSRASDSASVMVQLDHRFRPKPITRSSPTRSLSCLGISRLAKAYSNSRLDSTLGEPRLYSVPILSSWTVSPAIAVLHDAAPGVRAHG